MNYYKLALVIVVSVAISLLLLKACKPTPFKNNIVSASQDTIRVVRDKNGVQTASTTVMEGTVKELTQILAEKNALIKSKDESILRLQETVKKYKKDLASTTSISISTKDTAAEKTKITYPDSVNKMPVYGVTIIRKWARYDIRATKDSISLITDIRNDLDITQRYDKGKLIVDIKTLNPNTGTEEVKSYKPVEKKKHIAAKITVGIVMVEIGRVVLKSFLK